MEKVGCFLCTGCEIGAAIKTDGLEEIAKECGATSFVTNECLCAPEGAELIKKAVDSGELDGVLIAACSPRQMMDVFKYDPQKVAVERIGLRELVAWTHKPGDEDTQMLADDYIRMGVSRVTKVELPKPLEEAIDQTVLVVGGGLAGLTAAKASAALGHPVVLVEKGDKLGGYLAGVKDLVPEKPPYDTIHKNDIQKLIGEVEGNEKIKVHKSAKIKKIGKQPGQFEVEMEGGQSFKAGAIVQATGAKPYDASKLEHLGFGKSPDVITSQQLEEMILSGKLQRPSDGKQPGRVVFVQCAGSRDENHLPYCSSECCATTLKQVSGIRKDFLGVESAVVYRDLRTPGQLEHFYLGVQENSGGMFTRGEVDSVDTEGSKLKVNIKESLLGKEAVLEGDLVVLATGMVPSSADGEAIRQLADARLRIEKKESDTQVEEGKKLEEELKHHDGTEILNLDYRQGPDMPVLKYSFPDSHYICFPYETRRTGIYAAGAVHSPMDAAQAQEDGWGAAMKAVQCIQAMNRGEAVHPRAGDISIADLFLQRCTQCKRCTEECPFGTLNEDEKGTPEYNPLRCRRCGICLGSCPERIVTFPEYSIETTASMLKIIDVPEEDEEKPRMIAFVCENDAYPALDEAAAHRLQLSPWIRVIPVRCLGAVNVVWIADALSRGIDGILLLGCKKGDDYQCHYIRGSELAEYRMENVKETLERLTLESERVRIVDVARDDYARLPQIFEEFAEKIEEVGANPYKGW
jgi:quinone-modifying oxidoreductase subunit QmoB